MKPLAVFLPGLAAVAVGAAICVFGDSRLVYLGLALFILGAFLFQDPFKDYLRARIDAKGRWAPIRELLLLLVLTAVAWISLLVSLAINSEVGARSAFAGVLATGGLQIPFWRAWMKAGAKA